MELRSTDCLGRGTSNLSKIMQNKTVDLFRTDAHCSGMSDANTIVRDLLEDAHPGAVPQKQPSERKTITVGQILEVLPSAVQTDVFDVLNSAPIGSIASKLKPMLAPHAAALEQIGILVDYAAYALEYAASQLRQS